MSRTEQTMTPKQSASLLDAALLSSCPLTFLDATVTALKAIGRHEDANATAWVGCLYAEGEIEALMSLRAAWVRGEIASPKKAGQRMARSHRVTNASSAEATAGRGRC